MKLLISNKFKPLKLAAFFISKIQYWCIWFRKHFNWIL